MKFKKEDLLSITEDEYPVGFTAVEEGDWVQVYKQQLKEIVFKYQDHFYSLTESRTGSPFTDWYYDSEYWPDEVDLVEVVPVEKIIKVWERVK